MTTDECIEWLENEGTNYDNTPNQHTPEFLECAARLRELDAENADRDRRLAEYERVAKAILAYPGSREYLGNQLCDALKLATGEGE